MAEIPRDVDVAAPPRPEPPDTTPNALPVVRLQPGRDGRVRQGYPWVFNNELVFDATTREVPPGGLVRLVDGRGKALGIAGLNRHTLIAARLMTREPDERIDRDWFVRRIAAAAAVRDRLFDVPHYRLLHAEADGLPGLIADRYGDVVVLQVNTAVMDSLVAPILEALDAVLAPRAIVLRNDAAGREAEGLATSVGLAAGTLDGPVTVLENGARFPADPLGGQKTGWFFDQRDNRAFAARLAPGLDVLDVYAHTGGFAIQAARAGARSVVALDRSASALETAVEAATMNGVADRFEVVKADAFAEMQRMADAGRRFGVVIVDPPAFAKVKKDTAAALRGYRKMTRFAARLVAPGGYLVAASCSHHVDAPAFAEAVRKGLVEARRAGRILRQAGAGPDHPVHPHLPESAYLKAITVALD
ncbi:MAG: class I SAM-dependent rRNA methyltransferase [Azospirillaceae bacterium]